jgi:glucose/arabinose dehydrogenase
VSSYYATASSAEEQSEANDVPIVRDEKLEAQLVFMGDKFFTSMAFLDEDDFLVLEKNSGKVQRVVNGEMKTRPLLDVNVASEYERGLLGIALAKDEPDLTDNNKSLSMFVFLFYTESKEETHDQCPSPNYCTDNHLLLGNRLYRYELVNDKLTDPKLLLDLPVNSEPVHTGGVISIGPDRNVYVISGDGSFGNTSFSISDKEILSSQSSNVHNGSEPMGRGGILTVTQNGEMVNNSIVGNTYPANLYYAYGIRNSFGMDFDPLTGNLWDTENGPRYGDEINLVAPGFNSGWTRVQGIWENRVYENGEILEDPHRVLFDFDGKGNYSQPEFIWYKPSVAPTAIKFLDSETYGKEYENDMFVSDFSNGNIYHFDLNKDRTELVLEGQLKDKVANNIEELEDVIFAENFGRVTDMEVGPEGYLYILSHDETTGYDKEGVSTIYKIVPRGGENND